MPKDDKAKKNVSGTTVVGTGIDKSDMARALCELAKRNGGISCSEKDIVVESKTIANPAVSFLEISAAGCAPHHWPRFFVLLSISSPTGPK